MTNIVYLLIALAMVALNAFFVATEFAIVKVRSTRVQAAVARGVRPATAVREVIEDLQAYLSACQLGITLASLGLGWVGEPAFAHLIEPLFSMLGDTRWIAAHTVAAVLAFAVITVLHVVLGELVPKAIAIDRPMATSLLVAWPIQAFYRVFYPLIWVMNTGSNVLVRLIGLGPTPEEAVAHSEEELRMIVARSHKGGVLSEVHARLLARALDFPAHTVRQIMLPRGDIVYLDVERPYQENLRIARESGYTRYPLCEGGLDRILGVVHIKGMFRRGMDESSSGDLRQLAREPLFVPETLPIEQLLTLFQKKRQHMGIVIDEYGGTSGIVTLEDVLEELTGEIQDEYDQEEPKVQRLAGGRLSVDAALPLDEAEELLGIRAVVEGVDTLGGLAFTRLGRMPRVGDAIDLDGRSVEVMRVRGRRIVRLLVDALPSPEPEPPKQDRSRPDSS